MTDLPFKIRKEIEDYLKKEKVPDDKAKQIMEKAKQVYEKTLYDPDEPVGVVAAQSLSEPTTQMSLDYSEKVIVKHNGLIKITPIGEFIDFVLGNPGKENADGWETRDVSDKEVYVPSITPDEKIAWKQIKEVSRHKAPETLLEIKTLSGRKITATDSHSFFIRKNNTIAPVSGKDLRHGERIPAISLLPENCVQVLDTQIIIGEQKYVKKPLPQKLQLDRLLGWIFGAYIAEGNATKFYTSFSNTDPVFQERVRQFAEIHGFTFNEYENTRGFATGYEEGDDTDKVGVRQIRINSIQLSRLLEKSCGTGARDKKAPDFAYSAHIDFVSGLLGGYFDGDGSISVERRVIRAGSRSKNLVDGIALLLARFGIFARKGVEGPVSGRESLFTLSIPCKYAKQFREKIGFCVKYKSDKLEALCSISDIEKNTCHDYVDMIGGFDGILVNISKKLGLPSRYVNSATKRQKVGREALLRHIEKFEKISGEKSIDIKNELEMLKRMHSSDIVWDEIVSVSRVKPSRQCVYDFTVPGTESFTTFDGIVTHNTMRTYHFAGTAGIQVTLGLPRLLEIFDARKEPKTPAMTVFLTKECQSEEAAKKVAEAIKEVKIKDVVSSSITNLTDLEITCKLNPKEMKRFSVETKDLEAIKLRNVKIDVKGDEMIASYKKPDIKDIFKLKYRLFETYLKGIKGITQTVVNKESAEWVINTLGSDLKKTFGIPGVDSSRAISNNIFEVQEVLGIEAARNVIMKQAMYTIEEQGLGIDIRYLMLLADLMTVDGGIKAIGRYGIAGQKISVLARAAFEETRKHIIRAAVKGEVDELKGVVENIMVNQVIPVGTGSYDLIGRIPDGEAKKEKK